MCSTLPSFIRRNIDEIADDAALRWYGTALALVNVLTAYVWTASQPIDGILAPSTPPVCWPIFEGCYLVRLLDPPYIREVVIGFGLLAAWNAWLFLRPSKTTEAYWLLTSCLLLKSVVILQDFRLALNHHYMAGWLTLVFLLFPFKRKLIPVVLVSMYFWAGILKLEPGSQWLNGTAFYDSRPLGLPARLIPLECAYVVFIELAIVFGLLVRRRVIFWLALSQVLLFHVASFWVVGFFYPVLMFLLLSIVVFSRISRQPDVSREMNRESHRIYWWTSRGLLSLFSILQLQRLVFPGNSAMTGEGRLFALNMFDAPVECRATERIVDGLDAAVEKELRPPFVNTRLQCDPIVYFELAKARCRQIDPLVGGKVGLLLESRMRGGAEFHPLVDVTDMCDASVTYSIWRHNWWITPPSR